MLALILLLLSPVAHAAPAYFTTVFLDDEEVVYVGVKHGEPPGESQIVSLPFFSGDRTLIEVPEAIRHRDIIGLITQKEKLFVLSNGVGAPDDGPMLHVYDRAKNTWTFVGKVVCPTFTKVTLTASQMIFSCEIGKTRKGKSRISRRNISLKRERLYRNGVWRFPEFLLRYKGRTALLEGQAPTWDKLRLRGEDGHQRTISAEDLLKLPKP